MRMRLLTCVLFFASTSFVARAQDPKPKPEHVPADVAPQDPPATPLETPQETPYETPIIPPEAVPAPVPPTEALPPAVVTSTSATRAVPTLLAYARTWSEAEYEAELERLASTYPRFLRLGSLGTSKQGRRIALLTIGDLATDPDRRPAVLLATDLEARFGDRPGGPEAALFAVRTLLERAERETEFAEFFTGATLYAVPAPDPDGVFAQAAATERTCRLERNFPAGWQPSDAIECPQGPYPCSEPETRELARLVAARTNVAALAVLAVDPGPEAFDARTPPSAPLSRIAVRASLDARRLTRAREFAVAKPGGLAAFAHARSGACVLALDPWSGDEASGDAVRPAFAALPLAVDGLLRELPRLEGRMDRAERLRERLWLVEVEVRVAGGLPTASPEERAKAPASVWLDVEGARVSKIGARRDGQPTANLDVPRGRTWRIGHLDGNESLKLFLAVEGDEGGVLRLAFRSLRGGRAEFDVALGG